MTPQPASARILRAACALLACASLSACAVTDAVGDIFDDADPLPGERPANRIPIVSAEQVLTLDPELAGPVSVPAPYVNPSWPQTGGSPTHAMQNPAGGGFNRLWRRDIGEGDSRNSRITAQPVVEGGRIFVMDGRGEIVALDAETGEPQWRRKLESGNDRDSYGFGGGLAVSEGRVYVSSGVGLVAALNMQNGSTIWRTETDLPIHSAPLAAEGMIFVVTDDNGFLALDASDGDQMWIFQGIAEPARIMATPAPAALDGLVVAPFGSGELVALQAVGGAQLWQDALTRAGLLAPISTLNDVAGSPVIYDGVVYAMNHSGVLAAIELETGERLWDLPAGGTHMPWLAGEALFIVTTEAELAAVDRVSGQLRWLVQLPSFEDQEDRKDKIAWAGPVLYGGRLVVISSDGEGRVFDPETGQQTATFEPGDTYVSPIVANRTLYVLNSDGELIAYR